MKLRPIVRYRMNFDKKWLTASGVLMGVGFFLQVVYYFAVASILQVSAAEIVIQLVLPLLMEAGWFLLLRGFKLNAPGLYGIFGSVFAILLILQTFYGGSVFGGLIALVCLLFASVALLAVTGGFLRSKFAAVILFLAVIALRILFGGLSVKLLEAAALCDIGAILLFFGGLEITKKDIEI